MTEVTWENVPKTDLNGNLYTYFVKEIDYWGNYLPPEGYEKEENGLTVINRWIPTDEPEETTIEETTTNSSETVTSIETTISSSSPSQHPQPNHIVRTGETVMSGIVVVLLMSIGIIFYLMKQKINHHKNSN